jgi:HD-GYP domain-containing protein (c-di-GMP phosphodiesterase class II)
VDFNPRLVELFLSLSRRESFWLDIEPNNIDYALETCFPKIDTPLGRDDLQHIFLVFSHLVDVKSRFTRKHSIGLAEKAKQYSLTCNFSQEHQDDFITAALLHDIGKIAVPIEVLDRPSRLTPAEFQRMTTHPYYTRKIVSMMGIGDKIAAWAANHHEKLDGSGYPYGLGAEEMDFKSRALGFLDIFQALTESRPYRNAFSQEKAFTIIDSMVEAGKIDGGGVKIGRESFARSTQA